MEMNRGSEPASGWGAGEDPGGLWERLCQWRGAAGVSAWGGPDRPLSSVVGGGKDRSIGSRDIHF